MILSAITEKLKHRSKDDFKGRHFEASLILQAVCWYLHYPFSYRDIEELFLERGLAVDHATLNRWVLAYAPLIERRLRTFRKPHCGSIRIDETYIKIRGQWRYLYRAIDKHGTPVDFLLTAKRDLEAAKRFFRKMPHDQPLLAPDRIGTDGAAPYPPAIAAARKKGLLPHEPLRYVSKHLQQGIESDRVKRPMPRIGGFQSFHTARRTIRGFEAMLWLRKGLASRAPGRCASRTGCSRSVSDFRRLTKHETGAGSVHRAADARVCNQPRKLA
jgi:transposase, IS6 family